MVEKKEFWSIDELVSLTDTVQEEEIEFKGKGVQFQYCELAEEEEPKFTPLDSSATEEEKLDFYTKVGTDRIVKMIEKANKLTPDGTTINADNWGKLPTTLRYLIGNKMMGVEQDVTANFTL
jgi:hypothetical protein